MKFVINLIGKLAGAGKIISLINGKKTYISGSALILSGLSQLLLRICSISDTAGILDLVKNLPQDQGFLALMAGLAAVGLRHSNEKLEHKIAG